MATIESDARFFGVTIPIILQYTQSAFIHLGLYRAYKGQYVLTDSWLNFPTTSGTSSSHTFDNVNGGLPLTIFVAF